MTDRTPFMLRLKSHRQPVSALGTQAAPTRLRRPPLPWALPAAPASVPRASGMGPTGLRVGSTVLVRVAPRSTPLTRTGPLAGLRAVAAAEPQLTTPSTLHTRGHVHVPPGEGFTALLSPLMWGACRPHAGSVPADLMLKGHLLKYAEVCSFDTWQNGKHLCINICGGGPVYHLPFYLPEL